MSDRLKCIVIDDEPLARELIKSYVEKTPSLQLQGCYESAAEAIKSVVAGETDIVFLDIEMPMLNGIDFAEVIPRRTRIIYITAYERYALQGFKVNALDYLLKPISYPDFLKAANKALQWYEHMQAPAAEIESIFIKTEYKQVQVELRKILYIEGLKDYVKIFIEDEPHPILSLMSMKSLEEMLPASHFIRVHRSFIVQPEKIKVIERNRIVFGKEYIPISDNYKPRLVEFLAQRSLNFN